VIHADNTNAKGRADEGVNGITLGEQISIISDHKEKNNTKRLVNGKKKTAMEGSDGHTPWAINSVPMALHSTVSLAAAPRLPETGGDDAGSKTTCGGMRPAADKPR
jgi:hypothetical protein